MCKERGRMRRWMGGCVRREMDEVDGRMCKERGRMRRWMGGCVRREIG